MRVDEVADRELAFFWVVSLTPKRSAYITSALLSIIAKAASVAFGGSNQLLMKLTLNSTFGLTALAPAVNRQASCDALCFGPPPDACYRANALCTSHQVASSATINEPPLSTPTR